MLLMCIRSAGSEFWNTAVDNMSRMIESNIKFAMFSMLVHSRRVAVRIIKSDWWISKKIIVIDT